MPTLSICQQFNQRGHRRCVGAGKLIPSILAALFLLVAFPAFAEKVENLKPQGYVNDFASALDSRTVAQLTAICQEVDQKAQAQMAVVIVHTLEGLEAQDFATRLNERWKVGYKGTDRGVIILLAVDDHKYWFEVGYGLEPILPDGKVGGFGREMVPLLRQGDTSGAVLLATSRVAEVIAQDKGVRLESLASAPARSAPAQPSADQIIRHIPAWLVILIIFLMVRFIFSLFSPRRWIRGGWYGGGFGGGFGGGYGGGGGGGGGGFGGFGGGSSGGGGAGGSW
jgi:uncharacterized protein